MSSTFVILSNESNNGAMAPLGSRRDIIDDLSTCNTAPDHEGGDTLYGPGICIQLSPGQDPITQMLLVITEEEIGWMFMTYLARKFKWKILDPTTGREFSTT